MLVDGKRNIPAALVAAAVLLSGAAARAGPPRRGEAEPSLRRRVAAVVAAYEAKSKAVVGAAVLDLRTGKALFGLRASRQFVPASNQKLLTAAFALARLGGNFQFETAAYLVGKDLWVLGSGDPTFGDPRIAKRSGRTIYAELDRWAAAIRKARPRGIDGNIVVFTCFTPGQAARLEDFRHPMWPKSQHRNWYAAPVSGLNLHDNCFSVTFRRGAGGGAVPVVAPESRWIEVVNRIRPGKKHLWSLKSNADDSVLTIRGTVKGAGSSGFSVAANNPPLLLGRVLADRLRRVKVGLNGRVRIEELCPLPAAKLGKPVCKTVAPLSSAMRRMFKNSLNMAAECVMLRAGDGTWAGSARIMTEVLVREYGLDANSFVVSDGGGLSVANRVSPAAMVRLLARVVKRKDALVFLRSLPFSGTDGTLRKRLTRPPYRQRIVAKTGYILGVCALSGYALDARRRPAITFSVLVNGVPPGKAWVAKQLQDAVCRMLIDSLDGK